MSGPQRVLREFVGWWPVTVTLDGEAVADGSEVDLIALPAGARPAIPPPTAAWQAGHVNDADQLCVWLAAVTDPGTYYVYARPTPVDPEAPVYQLDGSIYRY